MLSHLIDSVEKYKYCTLHKITGSNILSFATTFKLIIYITCHSITKGMVRMSTNSKKCDFEGCSTVTPVFNYPGTKVGVRCAVHRVDGMVNVKSLR